MNLYEKLEDLAYSEGIVIDRRRKLEALSGMLVMIEGCPPIVHVSPALNLPESAGVLAEELGHYYTSSGDNGFAANKQQVDRAEERALRAAVRDVLQLHPDRIIALIEAGVSTFHELADRLEISEAFLARARLAWIAHYGLVYKRNDYSLYFDPLSLHKQHE